MICPKSGKQCYDTRRDAKDVRRRGYRLRQGSSARGRLRVYECPDCGYWHLGHLPREVVRKSRAEVFDGVKPIRRPKQKTSHSPAPPPAAASRLIAVPAHQWFAMQLCEEPRCGHEHPCPIHHAERRAA